MSNQILIDMLEKAEFAVERSEQSNAEIMKRTDQLFAKIENRLSQPTPRIDTYELNQLGRTAFGAIQKTAVQIDTQLSILKPSKRLKVLNRWKTAGIALIGLLCLLIAFVSGIFITTANPIFSKALLPYAHDISTCEGLGGWVQPATKTQGRLCVITID
ncbi:hypothetical protein [Flexibacterium corallicola]|uniref:hypothetical protein n=1 Tax=Flexibacterium corallicola TaxID=3037259 RepID=UPI00286EEFE3|nr:hypothetical protein [Pseudovibrio sp. M1P-2-3]